MSEEKVKKLSFVCNFNGFDTYNVCSDRDHSITTRDN